MKRGDRVKCVDNKGCKYLTKGKEYEVTEGVGDVDMFDDVIDDSDIFQVIDNDGDRIYEGLVESVHAAWELVE